VVVVEVAASLVDEVVRGVGEAALMFKPESHNNLEVAVMPAARVEEI
jgi:hypothetical protein